MFLSTAGPVRRWLAGTTAATLAALGLPLFATPASADSAPVAPVTVKTVTADSLPTVQINGVVWDQVIAGNRVYVTGNFTSARPAGVAAGTSETPRSNILAYDLTTGALVTSWAPSLNGQGLTIDASADGSRIYVGGEFTSVSGTARSRLAALDASSGALITAFNPGSNSGVRAIDVVGNTVYAGGTFTTVGGQARSRLAAFAADTGALLPWAPSVDSEVLALVAPPGTNRVVAGGRFEFANGQRVLGLAALDGTTGGVQSWEAYGVFPNYGPKSSIYSLSSDGTQVFGTAYDFGGPSPFEGTFGVDLMTGHVNWVNGCKGDTYDAVPIGDVLYSVGHSHDCGMIGGHPQTNPDWTFQRALATTKTPAPDGRVNTYFEYGGRPAPELLHWLPTVALGTFTGQYQGGWTITGNSEYVVMGGEFPRVNDVAQQGLTRFRISGPNKEGPQGVAEMQPNVVSLAPGAARVAWTAAWDRDNRQLTYEVLRGGNAATAPVVGTVKADSAWWDRKQLAFTDTSAAPGSSQTYRVRAKDAINNTVVGASRTVTVQAGTAEASAYRDAVSADTPSSYWRLGEPSGSVAYDWAGGSDLTVDASVARGTAGALPEQNTATTFSGSAGVPATTTAVQNGPSTFSVETWFKTSTTSGGKIIGFGNSSTGDSSGYDRHVYMTNDGRVVFGVYPNAVRTVASGPGLNDDKWHHVVGTLSGAGQELYVDGKRVGRRTDTTSAQAYSGVWRIGGDSLGGWDQQPTSNKFAGAIDEAAVYPTALSAARVQAHFAAAGGQVRTGVRPSDTYGQAVYDVGPDSYWRLNETTGTTATDVTANAADGVYSGGATLGVAGKLPGTAVQLDGVDDFIAASQPTSNPAVYSEELWFNTTTTRGGKLIGFGDAQTGNSGNYDRHVWMQDDGKLNFGVWTGQANIITSPSSYNDGQWHHLVAAQGGEGMKLYVDGQSVGTNPQTAAQSYTGYWRVGGDTSWGGSSWYFAGSIDDVAVYSSVLTPAQVTDHFSKGGGQAPPTNAAPAAAFTSTPTNLAVAVDGSGSTDADGTISTWAWEFGDTGTATGATANHTYAAPGTYDVKLTVTDNGGATGTITKPVTVTAAPPAAQVFAADTFNRTTASGLGTAETGGAWTVAGTAANYTVGNGAGRMVATGAGSQRTAYLGAVSQTDTDVTVSVALDKVQTGGGTNVSVIGRRVGTSGNYEVKLRYLAGGALSAQLLRVVGTTETVLGTATVAGITYAPGEVLRIRMQTTGAGTTNLSTKVWRQGATEPAAWLLTRTDTTPALQAPGGVGLELYLSTSSTNAPMTATFDDFTAGPPAGV